MAEGEAEEQDMYVAQLREVFDSCDATKTGYLSRQELATLCDKLQLDDQSPALIQQLLGDDPNARVGFDEFKEGFVSVLSSTGDGIDTSDGEEDDDDDDDIDDRASPKLVKGDKKYGRRSRPQTDTEGDDTPDPDSARHNLKGLRLQLSSLEGYESNDEGETKSDKSQKSSSDRGGKPGTRAETFEAEGQMKQSIAEMENALDPVTEEQHLRSVWKELGVGKDGSLAIHELAIVCEHIGMDEMSSEELQHLFDKLDVDGDGKVSFQEFLHGLFQHGGSTTPCSTPARPLSTPRQKLKMSLAGNFDGRQTPSFISSGSGIFTALDTENTGYAKPDSIVELWENLGVAQGADILEYLQFDLNTKVSLVDLSCAMEQEMRSVEEDNATYQAAIVTYEYELKHLKTSNDQVYAEKEKLRTDLTEAHSRIALLIKEGDDRCSALERSKERELLTVERKYQDQLKALQAEVDHEREVTSHQSSKQRQKLEAEIARLKEEEARLREKLALSQRELDKLEKETLDMSEKCSALEKQNTRQQKELEGAADLSRKLDELESNREIILDEQQKFSEQKLKQLETDNKELKDKNDELTMEVEDLKQTASLHKQKRSGHNKDSENPRRTGSILSDYAKPLMAKNPRGSFSETNSDDEDSGASTSSKPRRQLPQRPSREPSVEDEKELERLRVELEELKKEKDAEQRHLQQGFSMERKDIEDSYKMEIAHLEDVQIKGKNDLIKSGKREKAEMEEEFQRRLKERLVQQEEELQSEMEKEKEDWAIRTETEKNLLKIQLEEEKSDVINSLKEQFEADVRQQLGQRQALFDRELEETVSRDRSNVDDLRQQKANMELEVKHQEQELLLRFERELQDLKDDQTAETAALQGAHRADILHYEAMFTKGVDGLEGKLRNDFYALLDKHRAEAAEDETNRFQETFQKEQATLTTAMGKEHERLQQNLQEEFDVERQHIADKMAEEQRSHKKDFENEKNALTEKFHKEKAEIEERLQQRQNRVDELVNKNQELREQHKLTVKQLETKCSVLEQDVQREGQGMEEQSQGGYQQLPEQLEEELRNEIQARLEDEFQQQMESLREAFKEERSELESSIRMLEQELDEVNQNRDFEHQLKEDSAIERNRELEARNTVKLEEMSQAISRLREDKDKVIARLREDKEKLVEDKFKLRQEMEARIQQLTVERQEAVVRASTSALQTGIPSQADGERERAIFAAIEGQKRHLEEKTIELRRHIDNLQGRNMPHSNILQSAHDKLVDEKLSLSRTLQKMEGRMQELMDQSLAGEHCKARMENWESERDGLRRQLDLTSDKLTEANAALALTTSEHVRELQALSEKAGDLDDSKYQGLHQQHVESQRKVGELEAAMEQRAAETSKLLASAQEDHKRALQKLDEQHREAKRKLKNVQFVLEEHVQKLKASLENCCKSDLLVKDLYVENSNLVKCLQITEQREKRANSRVYKLEENCIALKRVIAKITAAAIG